LRCTIFSITLTLLFTCSSGVHAMAFLDTFKIYVFSEMNGTVLDNGKPVEGAILKRRGDHYNDKVYEDTTSTDKEGKFHFAAISTWSLRPLMWETVIKQDIMIYHDGKEHIGWSAFKQNTHQRGELVDEEDKNATPINCVFHLDQDDSKKQKIELSEYSYRSIRGLCEIAE